MKSSEFQLRYKQLKAKRDKLFRDFSTSPQQAKLLVQLKDIDEEIEELVSCMNLIKEVYTKSKGLDEEAYG